MCLISWFPAGRCLKETLMRSLLLPQDYLEEKTEGEELFLDWIRSRPQVEMVLGRVFDTTRVFAPFDCWRTLRMAQKCD